MKKQDLMILAALFALWVFWPQIDRHLLVPIFGAKPKPVPAQKQPASTNLEAAVSSTGTAKRAELPETPAIKAPPEPAAAEPAPALVPEAPEQFLTLTNADLEVTFSSHGGAISRARMLRYRQTRKADSGPVEFDFSGSRSLALDEYPDFGEGRSFALNASSETSAVVFTRSAPGGVSLARTFTLAGGYRIEITDVFKNETAQPVELPAHLVKLGPLGNLPGETLLAGMNPLGVDTLSPAEKVRHWAGKIQGWIDKNTGLAVQKIDNPVDWIACKNKYFTQNLVPSDGGKSAYVYASKPVGSKHVAEVRAAMEFQGMVLKPGEAYARQMYLYLGPKKLSELKKIGMSQSRIMELGWMTPISELLLRTLNVIEAAVKNYGVAIMILTLLIKVIFWPITHRGTESMRRMQEFSPAIKALGEKYKDNPQRKQQEIMAFYKKHKINPLGGCLPMVIQIPVFIGLFYVLRSAIELRFADFLWIHDLSEPERILDFGFKIPLIGWDSLNILPILMTVTMIIQMKVAPTSAPTDDQQAQMQAMMMKVMPVMMLFFLYNFPAGLALYWTTQNVLMIGQQIVYKKRKAAREAQGAAPAKA